MKSHGYHTFCFFMNGGGPDQDSEDECIHVAGGGQCYGCSNGKRGQMGRGQKDWTNWI